MTSPAYTVINKPLLQEILKSISADYFHKDTSLLMGNPGKLLLNILCAHYFPEDEQEAFISAYLEDIVERLADNYSYTFCDGRSGVYWMYKYLCNLQLIDTEDLEMLCCEDQRLRDTAIQMLQAGNCDFLHGATGIAYSLLYNTHKNDLTFFKSFFAGLNRLLTTDNATGTFQDFSLAENRIVNGKVNLGLAHGIPGILKFCIQCYNQNICIEEAKSLGQHIIHYLINHKNDSSAISTFPYTVETGKELTKESRLAWCYGDLSTGFILYQGGIAFNDATTVNFALHILEQSTERRSTEHTGVADARICHGAAGIAHIYNKMWHYTQNPVFEEGCDYWIQKTIDYIEHDKNNIKYEQQHPAEEPDIENSGLLYGNIGIGLVLLSYLTGDFSWDYCVHRCNP